MIDIPFIQRSNMTENYEISPEWLRARNASATEFRIHHPSFEYMNASDSELKKNHRWITDAYWQMDILGKTALHREYVESAAKNWKQTGQRFLEFERAHDFSGDPNLIFHWNMNEMPTHSDPSTRRKCETHAQQ